MSQKTTIKFASLRRLLPLLPPKHQLKTFLWSKEQVASNKHRSSTLQESYFSLPHCQAWEPSYSYTSPSPCPSITKATTCSIK
ncbi:hypothetical protein QVD17_15263 [Tagetes erecta]|uniref:Uncharacterized protein n=1 Tax=Tagetes erecta TaxID=13708 RepID=A0AAD8NZC8_TARER|nr:hypothetical protein QVD17_15263 [Tagetes erecta]